MASGVIYQTVVEVLSGLTTTTTTTTTTTSTTVPGSVCYGHDTAVEEDFIEDFTGKWEGTADITGSGDAEKLTFDPGDHKQLVNPHWYGTNDAVIKLNKYQTGDNVSIWYKTAGSIGGIAATSWTSYSGKFTSQGFVDVLLGRDYTLPSSTTTTTTITATTSTFTTTTTVTTSTTAPHQVLFDYDTAHGDAFSDYSYGGTINYRLVLLAADLSNGGTNKEVRIKLRGHTTIQSTITGISFGERSSVDDFVGTPTRFTKDGDSSFTLSTSASEYTDWVEMDVDDTADHLLHIYQGESTNYYRSSTVTQNPAVYRERPGTGDDTMIASVSYSGLAFWYFVEEIQIRDSQTIAAEAMVVMSGDL